MEKALITGGAGCLGRAIAELLAPRGVSVRILDRRPPTQLLVPFEFAPGDITDVDSMRRAASGVDTVFNLAALQPVSRADDDFWRVNVEGTQNVLDAAARGTHVVHLSSSIVYGVPHGRPFREEDALRPVGRYGESKVEAERRGAQARARGLTVTIIRPRMIMGPGRLGLLSILFAFLREGRRVYMLGSGKNRFQMADSKDLARACIAAAERRVDTTLNIGSDDVEPVRDVLEALLRHAGSPSRLVPLPAPPARLALRILDRLDLAPLTAEHYVYADKEFVLDTGRAKRLLDWTPQVRDAESLCRAYDFYRENAGGPRDFAPDHPPLRALEILRRLS